MRLLIAAKHIESGITKYKGVIDPHIESLIKASNLKYKPYVFNDGRILLVLPNNLGAFLYKDKDTLFWVCTKLGWIRVAKILRSLLNSHRFNY